MLVCYYQSRELVPTDMLADLDRAKIVITNFHAFKLRETMPLSKGGRSLLQGRGEELKTLETEGQMLQRVMPDLMGMKNIMVLNDEAHHCYREKAGGGDEDEPKGEEREEAEKNREAARLWISGLEIVSRKLGINRIIDLSATPFFLRGSGYAEGTLFPWTMSDFSLMGAIECGIVKLPRVPVADNAIIPGEEMPKFRAVATTRSAVVVANFAAAIATAIGLLSIPIVGHPSRRAAKLDVPRPQNGSAIHPRGLPCRASTRNGNARGNIV